MSTGRRAPFSIWRRGRSATDRVATDLARSAYERALAETLDRVAPSGRRSGEGVVAAFASAEPEQGSSALAANLAVYAAQRRRRRTLAVDASPFAPSLHERFRTALAPGLAERLASDVATNECMHATVFGRLDVTPAGDKAFPERETALAAFERFIAEARREFELVLIDLAAVGPGAAQTVLASVADRCVLVVDPARGRQGRIAEAADRLRVVGATLAGFVFNHDER